ncbi:MAG: ribonuclease Z [Ktedonobacteraceae bacterium]
MSSLILLGTGTCQIEHEHRASSVLIELHRKRVLFDCGHGTVQRLLEVGVRHSEIEHVVVSHFHPDHISDLVPLLHAGAWSRRNPRTTDLHIYGQPGLQRVFDGLKNVFGASSFEQSHYQIVIHEVTDGPVQTSFHMFEFISLPPTHNHGLRFEWGGKRYAITGDSHFHEQEIDFLRDVDMAIIDSGHLQDEEIVQIALASRAKTIICSHLYRQINALQLQALAESAGYTGTIIVGHDLLKFIL